MENVTVAQRRWYVRCVDCLSIGVVETNPRGTRWNCGVCTGNIETMGEVIQNHLEKETTRTACDLRCTHARGPLCVCKCGCVNHGTGRVVKIVMKLDIPTIEFPDAEKSLAIATEYRNALAVVNQKLSDIKGYFRYNWSVRKSLNAARDARKHETRMKRIAETAKYFEYAAAATVATVTTAPYQMSQPIAPVATPARVAVTGNTYPVREQLKKLGGQWNALDRAWMIPTANVDAARSLVAAQPAFKSVSA